MVLGIGVDIIEIERIQASYDKFGTRFLNKIFTQLERDYCMNKKNFAQHLAARFAAKEAISKAIGTGWNDQFRWQDIEVENQPGGAPKVNLYGNLKKHIGDDKELMISISHSHHYVTCFAILQSK